MMAENKEVFSWDDEVEESSFEILPDGDYKFTVSKFEKGWYEPKGNSTLPECDQALLEFTINWINESGEAKTNKIGYDIKLCRKLQFLTYQFFECIGLRKKGDGTTKMPWSQVEGRSGICQIGHYEGKNGNVYNQVIKCYPVEDAPTVTKNEVTAPKKPNFNI